MKRIDLAGQRFGRLTVLRQAPSRPGQHGAKWVCRCNCSPSKEHVVYGHSLRAGRTQSCGCWRRESGRQNVIDLVGQKFGRVTVLERIGSVRHGKNGSAATWKVRCDCGETKVIRGNSLRNGGTLSCGCLHKEAIRLAPGQALRNTVLMNYKNNSRYKNHEWALSDEQFDLLTQSSCHYCGAEPSTILATERHHGSFTYNGIDRMDNAVGYILSNVTSCCKPCQYAKRDMPYEEFKAWARRLGAYQLGLVTAVPRIV